MNEYELNIFTMYYKRIMRVENSLKTLLISRYTNLYNKNNVYKITYAQFFSKTEKNKHQKDMVYTKLFNSNKTDDEKFVHAIRKMYLSEVTNFLGHPVFLKSRIRKNFFQIDTDTKTTTFQNNARLLNDFRNSIAHIDEKKFNKDKKRFLKALNYFERLLCLNNILTIEALNHINPRHKLSTTDILKIIYKTDRETFKDDRVLLSIFDEIAFLNGYTFETLPQRWTIIRQKFNLEKNLKEDEILTSENNMQLSLNL